MENNTIKKSVYPIVFMLLIGLFFGTIGYAINNDDNNPPNPPEITGPKTGKINEVIQYEFYITDPDVDDRLLQLEINFGGELIIERCDTGECKPWRNGETVKFEYIWKETGTFSITAKVMDVYGEWSEWSDSFEVSMTKIKIINKPLLGFLENQPLILSLIQKLLGLVF